MALNNLGSLYQKNNMFEDALKCYKRVIEINPNNDMAHYNLGAFY